jgi:hypothetical protein
MRHRWFAFLLSVSLLCLQPGFSFSSDLRPTFLVLADGTDINDAASRLQAQGLRVHTRVPPSILTVDLPIGFTTKDLAGVKMKTMYQNAIPLNALETLGTMAMAAGMQWNRSFLSAGRTTMAGASSFAAMRSLVAERSLRAPDGITAAQDGSVIAIAWQAVPSALYYQVEMAADAGFANRIYATNTNKLQISAPTPQTSGPVDLFYRVRAADHGDDDHLRENNIFGGWSNAIPLRIQGTSDNSTLNAPTPASPRDKYQSEGFTVPLEWNDTGARNYRIQVAGTQDFMAPYFDEVVADRTFLCPGPVMELGDHLFWRVRAWDDQKSAWSKIYSFTINPPSRDHSDVFANPEAPK